MGNSAFVDAGKIGLEEDVEVPPAPRFTEEMTPEQEVAVLDILAHRMAAQVVTNAISGTESVSLPNADASRPDVDPGSIPKSEAFKTAVEETLRSADARLAEVKQALASRKASTVASAPKASEKKSSWASDVEEEVEEYRASAARPSKQADRPSLFSESLSEAEFTQRLQDIEEEKVRERLRTLQTVSISEDEQLYVTRTREPSRGERRSMLASAVATGEFQQTPQGPLRKGATVDDLAFTGLATRVGRVETELAELRHQVERMAATYDDNMAAYNKMAHSFRRQMAALVSEATMQTDEAAEIARAAPIAKVTNISKGPRKAPITARDVYARALQK